MKKIICFLLLALAVAGCEKEVVTPNGKLDPNATINIRPAPGTKLRSASASDTTHLTALQIVNMTTNMEFSFEGSRWDRGFAPLQRDTAIPCLKMWGSDIIDQEGLYHTKFIESSDCILIHIYHSDLPDQRIDTIAYIPNSVLSNAKDKIRAAFDAQNYTKCYALFDSAFVFIPITGEEWRELKAINQQ